MIFFYIRPSAIRHFRGLGGNGCISRSVIFRQLISHQRDTDFGFIRDMAGVTLMFILIEDNAQGKRRSWASAGVALLSCFYLFRGMLWAGNMRYPSGGVT